MDVARLRGAYADLRPDVGEPSQRVAFGASGHRGSSFDRSFNEWHVLAITQAICEYRAKAGITGFTRAAAMEAAPHGIRVNAVAPGLAWNPFLGKIYGEEYVEEMARQTPLGRVGQPQDVANAVAFLASEKASFITGEVLCVSGGYHLHT